LAASSDSVAVTDWGAGVDGVPSYTFTAGDNGTHVFTPKFRYVGDQVVTVTDMAWAPRTVQSAGITVTSPSPTSLAYDSAPSGVTLTDGSTLWAYLGIWGRLYARRSVGTLSEPAWRPGVVVREPSGGTTGADSPSVIRLGSTLALFHTFTDGTYLQVWRTLSTDSGATWGAPVQMTTETVNVQHVQAVVTGSTVYLFYSLRDTQGRLYYQTSTDLTNWSAKTLAGQTIGAHTANTTSNFGVVKPASGGWLLGWLAPSAVGEAPNAGPGDPAYPTVHVATSTDLAAWGAASELNLAYSQRGPRYVAVGQDGGGTIRALYEQTAAPSDTYVVQRTSTDAANWAAQTVVFYDRAGAANGAQGYAGAQPALVPGASLCAAAAEVWNGALPPYGHGTWADGTTGKGVTALDCAAPAETAPMPYGEAAQTNPCMGGSCPVLGYATAGRTDLAFPGRGVSLGVSRTYISFDGVLGHDGPFGYGWSWSYGARAVTHLDGSVAIIEGSGRRTMFWKTGASWTAGPAVNATLAAAGGGGYTLTRKSQSVWSFDGAGKLTAITDRSGNSVTLSYSGNSVASVTASGGRSLTVTTNGQGRITQIVGPGNLSTSYTYDGAGNLATVTDAAGKTTTYTYDARHQLLTIVDARGNTAVTSTYGTLGRLATTKDALN
ncbi:MAG: DUF6531 domain-containing protein, partial [Dehalococcoidia bacterium]